MSFSIKISYDKNGTPGFSASDPQGAYFGLGFVHGLHRPLPALALSTLGKGELARHLLPVPQLVAMDAMVHRLDLARVGQKEVHNLEPSVALLMDAYLDGFEKGVQKSKKPLFLQLLGATLPLPDRASLLSSMLIASYMGLAQGQERMESALVEALKHGADPAAMQKAFAPHLQGWDPARLRGIESFGEKGPFLPGFLPGGGSNAWAASGARSKSGHALFASDPHLQINILPGTFLEVRARVGKDFWLGGTVPGLPTIGVGRNKNLAWSGTFGVADNVDFSIHKAEGGRLFEDGQLQDLRPRNVELGRRFLPPLKKSLLETADGSFLTSGHLADGDALSSKWVGRGRAAESMGAYIQLPLAQSLDEAEALLQKAGAFSMHYLLASKSGEVRHIHAGQIPDRSPDYSGLYPQDASLSQSAKILRGSQLPRHGTSTGFIYSANEALQLDDGRWLSTLAAPPYRYSRIQQLLESRELHDIESFQSIQLDRFSLQANRLRGRFLAALDSDSARKVLSDWDGKYETQSSGAAIFEELYARTRNALSFWLGGEFYERMLLDSEMSIWWMKAIDGLLDDAEFWRDGRLHRALNQAPLDLDKSLADLQTYELEHLFLDFLPRKVGLSRGPMALQGARATVQQGTMHGVDGAKMVAGPAYRFITDLGEERAFTTLPGGIDEDHRDPTYAKWLSEWHEGRYHTIEVPRDDEAGFSISTTKTELS